MATAWLGNFRECAKTLLPGAAACLTWRSLKLRVAHHDLEMRRTPYSVGDLKRIAASVHCKIRALRGPRTHGSSHPFTHA